MFFFFNKPKFYFTNIIGNETKHENIKIILNFNTVLLGIPHKIIILYGNWNNKIHENTSVYKKKNTYKLLKILPLYFCSKYL